MKNIKPNFRTVNAPPDVIVKLHKEWNDGNVDLITVCMDSPAVMVFLSDNIEGLLEMGKYEQVLLEAATATSFNFSGWSLSYLDCLFDIADIDKLRAAGDPIPDQEYFTLYRGVAGKGPARRVRGYSWTSSPGMAAWFACRFAYLGDPAVFKITERRDQILAAHMSRGEQEYLLKRKSIKNPKRLKEFPEPLKPV